MSFTSDLKNYADAAVETGRAAVNDGLSQVRATIDSNLDTAGNRATNAATTANGLGTHALNRARYNAYAVVGAGDAAVTSAITRAQEFPGEVAGFVAKVQTRTGEVAERLQNRFYRVAGKAGEAAGTAQGTVEGVRSGATLDQARTTAQAYAKRVNVARDDLYNRGEHVVAQLRKDPRVARVAGLVGDATDTVADAAATPARRRSAEKAAATRTRNARSASAKKAATTRARKTPAKKATRASSAR